MTDLLLGAASSAVERFDVGNVGVGEVTDEHLKVMPAGVAEGELHAGVEVLTAADHAGLFGSVRQVDVFGDFGDLGVFLGCFWLRATPQPTPTPNLTRPQTPTNRPAPAAAPNPTPTNRLLKNPG